MNIVRSIKTYFHGLRTWVEYGLKQSKNELGWADFRLTRYRDIEKWWEIVCSAYLMVSLQSSVLASSHSYILTILAEHPGWDKNSGCQNLLNNLRLIVQLFWLFNLIKPWLKVFSIPQLSTEFNYLMWKRWLALGKSQNSQEKKHRFEVK